MDDQATNEYQEGALLGSPDPARDGPVGGAEVEAPSEDPRASVRSEFEAFLDLDQSRIGEVYRLKRGLDADKIAEELDVSTSNFVWNYSRIIGALVDGNLPTAPTVALATARKFRALLKLKHWSSGARDVLTKSLAELELRAEERVAQTLGASWVPCDRGRGESLVR